MTTDNKNSKEKLSPSDELVHLSLEIQNGTSILGRARNLREHAF